MPLQSRIPFEPVTVLPPRPIPGLTPPSASSTSAHTKTVKYSDHRGRVRGDLRAKIDKELSEYPLTKVIKYAS